MAEGKQPYVSEPTDQSAGRPATFIYMHGYGDEAEGLPLGLAQQFQFHSKLPYLRWVLPNAPLHPEALTQAWYMPKALPNALKPRVPGEAEEDDTAPDDEEGILKSVAKLDELIEGELKRGVDGKRIVVGGFSQGCAVSIVWGLAGKYRNAIGGVVCMSGYFPLADRIEALQKERPAEGGGDGGKKWFYVHGSKDMLVPLRLFAQGTQELIKWVPKDDVDGHVYDGMTHSTNNAELRDLLGFLNTVVPP